MLNNYDKIITFNYKTYNNLKRNGYKKKSYYVPLVGNIKKGGTVKHPNIKEKINIISSVGDKTSANNTISNYYIFKYLIPELNKILNNKFKIITFGKGNFRFDLNNFTIAKKYHFDKGFVKNYTKEFKKNHILLLCQNSLSTKKKFIFKNQSWDYHLVHARIFDAFNNGICIVAFSENTKSMPELKNNYNCLTGSSAKELSNCVKRIYTNIKLRKKLIINGKETLAKFYDNKKNLNNIAKIIAS